MIITVVPKPFLQMILLFVFAAFTRVNHGPLITLTAAAAASDQCPVGWVGATRPLSLVGHEQRIYPPGTPGGAKMDSENIALWQSTSYGSPDLSKNHSVGAYYLLNPGEGHMAGGFRVSFQILVSSFFNIWGCAFILYNAPSIADEYNPSVYNHKMLTTTDGSQLGYEDLPWSLAIEVDLVNDGDTWDGPAPHLSIHRASNGGDWNNAGSRTRIGTQQNFTFLPQQKYTMIIEYNPIRKQLTAELAGAIVVADIDSSLPPYWGSPDSPFTAVGFSGAKLVESATQINQIVIYNFKLNTVPYSSDLSELKFVDGTNGTFISRAGYAKLPQAIFYFKDVCGTPMSPPLLRTDMNVVIKDSKTDQQILTQPDGEIKAELVGSQLQIFFYMKHSSLVADVPRTAYLSVSFNNVVWTNSQPTITFVRAVPSPSLSNLTGPSVITIGVPQMYKLALINIDGVPAIYDNTSMLIKYGLEVDGWVEQTAIVNIPDPTTVLLPLAPLRFYPNQPQTNLYIKFGLTKVKWLQVSVSLKYTPTLVPDCYWTLQQPIATNFSRDYIFKHSTSTSSYFQLCSGPNFSSKPVNDIWLGSAFVNRPIYLGGGFTWKFFAPCASMAAILFAGDHPPNASDYTPTSYGQDLTVPISGHGWSGMANAFAMEFSNADSFTCNSNFWRSNSSDSAHPISMNQYGGGVTSRSTMNDYSMIYDPRNNPDILSITGTGYPYQSNYVDFRTDINITQQFLQSQPMWVGFVIPCQSQSSQQLSPTITTQPLDPALSYMTFTQTNTLTYRAQAEFSTQPQAVVQLIDRCGRITYLDGLRVNISIVDSTPNSPTKIQTKVVPSKGQYQLFWYSRGADQPFQADMTVTVNGTLIKNTAITLTFTPNVPLKEQSTLPPNITMMVAGVSYPFEMILRDQFQNLAFYDPTQAMIAYGVLGQTLTNATQVNAALPSKVQFTFSISQVPSVNPLTFIIKYGSDVWSSYQVLVVSSEVDPTQTRLSSLAASQWVGSSQSLNISICDKYGNPVSAKSASITFTFLFVSSQHPSGLSAFTNGVRPSGSLVFLGDSNIATLTLTSNVAGNHSLQVSVKDQLQLAVSILVLVPTNLSPVSSAIVSSISLIDSSRTDMQPSFTLDLFDVYLNPVPIRVYSQLFEVALQHTSSQHSNVKTTASCYPSFSSPTPPSSSTGVQALCVWDDVKLGYTVTVQSSVAGQYRVSSKSPNNIMNVSSSLLTVIPGPISALRSTVQLAVSSFAAGTFPLTITLKDAFGQERFDSDDSAAIEVRLISSRNGDILNGVMKLTSNGSATYRVTNTPTQVGSYLLSIVVAKELLPLTSDQVKITVLSGEIDPSRTSYSLASSSTPSVVATQPFNFTLITHDSYNNQLTHGGAKIILVNFTFLNSGVGSGTITSSSSSSSSSTGENSNATSSGCSTGARRLLASVADNTYSVTDHNDGTYTIVVTFSNSNANSALSLQLLIDGESALPTPAIAIQPADPCLFTSRVCGLSKRCSSTFNNLKSEYSHDCYSIMTITSITPLVTGTNGGGAPITITLSEAPDANQPVIMSVRGPSHSFLANATQQSDQFRFFLPPALQLGYTQNEIPQGTSEGQLMSFTVDTKIGGIYYSVASDTKLKLINSSCFTPDYFWRVVTDECIPCPMNGYCPGGNQMYPIAGYYSNSPQDESPKSCTPSSACKGFSAESIDPTTGKQSYDLASQCGEGYQGKLCSQCDSAYYKDQQVCRSCGLDDTARRQFILVIVLGLVVFTVMALGVAFVDDSKLSMYIAVIVLIQHCSFVGSVGASHISASGLSEFFQFISLLNFEIAYFKLGCSVPQITYVKVFWATVLLIVIAAVMVILASGLFALTRSAAYLAEKETTRMEVWTRRIQNSLTILGVVVYLQMTTQFFKGLYCVDLDGQSVLQVEASTACYEGGHLATVIFIWPLLFIYSLGFPLLCCRLVLRTRSLNQWASSAAKYIYIYRGLKIRFIYFKCFNFITSFALALQITLSTTSNVTVRMATAFLFFSLDVFSIGVYWPYFKRTENLIAICGGIANALCGLAILTILSAQSGLEEQKLGELSGGPLFAVGLAVLVGLLLLIFPIRYLAARYFPSPESPEDDKLLLEGKYDELAASRSKKGLGTLHFETKKHATGLSAVGKNEKALHLDDAASSDKADGANEIEMMHNPMVKLDIADVSLSIPTKSDVPLSSPTHETATGDVTTIDPTANSDMMPHALASPSASSSSPPPLPFSTNVNGHEHQISKLPNPDSSSEGLASPSRFASPIEEDQQEESTHGGTDERKE